jgi:PAS domain S-box-containing protein
MPATPDAAAFLVALDGAIAGWGAGATSLFGYAADELVGQSVSVLLPPDEASEFPRILAAVARGEAIDANETMCHKDGTRLEVWLTVTPSRNGGGRVTGARAVARDVSGERAEEARSRLAAFLESTPDAIYTLDNKGVIQTWNHGAERLYGYAAHQAIGLPGTSLFPAGHHEEARMACECVLAGEPVQLFETEARRDDAVLVPVSLNLWPVRDRAGDVVGISVIARNLTDERLAQAALAESEVRLKESESLVHVGGWVWDVGTGAVQWSEELHRIHGLDPARFAGTIEAHLELVHPADRQRVRAAMTAAVSLHRPLETEYRIVRPDGSVRHLYARAEVALAPSDAVVVAGLRGICQDVTRRTLATADRERELVGTIRAIVDQVERLEPTGLRPDQVDAMAGIRQDTEHLLALVDVDPGTDHGYGDGDSPDPKEGSEQR